LHYACITFGALHAFLALRMAQAGRFLPAGC
jgi:hypothetical protein